jgi:hypothetical protein
VDGVDGECLREEIQKFSIHSYDVCCCDEAKKKKKRKAGKQ